MHNKQNSQFNLVSIFKLLIRDGEEYAYNSRKHTRQIKCLFSLTVISIVLSRIECNFLQRTLKFKLLASTNFADGRCKN